MAEKTEREAEIIAWVLQLYRADPAVLEEGLRYAQFTIDHRREKKEQTEIRRPALRLIGRTGEKAKDGVTLQ